MNDNVRYGLAAIAVGLVVALIATADTDTIRGVGFLVVLIGAASVGWGLLGRRVR